MLRRATLFLCCLALAASAALAQGGGGDGGDERPTSFVGGRVKFSLPAGWDVKQHVGLPANGRALLQVKYAPADGGAAARPHGALAASVVPEGVTVRHLSDGVYKNRYDGLAVLSDTFDGEQWRTMVWTARGERTPYVVLHRFGLVNRVSVELSLMLPLKEGGEAKWLERAVADFNKFCEGLKVDGQGKYEAKVRTETLSQPAKAGQLK